MHKTLLTLASSRTLSYFESALGGFQIRQCHSLESLKSLLKRPEETFILAEFPHCTPRHVEAFMALKSEKASAMLTARDIKATAGNSNLKIMIYSQSIDFSIYQQYPRNNSLLLVSTEERTKAGYLATKFIQGTPVFRRHSQRQEMSSPVLVKSTQWVATSQSLPQRKGRFVDFAKLGAKLYIPQRSFQVKDYVSVMYQSQNQDWITVECQLRWEEPTADGGQMLGVQFLAIA